MCMSAATNWLPNDVDIKTVQSWLGHSAMEATLRYLKAASARKLIVRDKVNFTFASGRSTDLIDRKVTQPTASIRDRRR